MRFLLSLDSRFHLGQIVTSPYCSTHVCCERLGECRLWSQIRPLAFALRRPDVVGQLQLEHGLQNLLVLLIDECTVVR